MGSFILDIIFCSLDNDLEKEKGDWFESRGKLNIIFLFYKNCYLHIIEEICPHS